MNKGFTLLEVVITAFLTALISIGIMTYYTHIYKLSIESYNNNEALYEINTFMTYLSNDIHTSNSLNLSSNNLILYNSNGSINYNVLNNNIYRNNKILVSNINKITFTEDSINGITVDIKKGNVEIRNTLYEK